MRCTGTQELQMKFAERAEPGPGSGGTQRARRALGVPRSSSKVVLGLTWATCSLEDVGVIICQAARVGVCVSQWVCFCVELACPGALVPNRIKGILAAEAGLLFYACLISVCSPDKTHCFTLTCGTVILQRFLQIYPQHRSLLPSPSQHLPKSQPLVPPLAGLFNKVQLHVWCTVIKLQIYTACWTRSYSIFIFDYIGAMRHI